MTKQDIIEYVMNTPYNTNLAVLKSMLEQLVEENESNLDSESDPEPGESNSNPEPDSDSGDTPIK